MRKEHRRTLLKKGESKLRVYPKSIIKMKDKLRLLLNKNNGWLNDYRRQKLRELVIGWVNYFALANMKTLFRKIDKWIRKILRFCIVKHSSIIGRTVTV